MSETSLTSLAPSLWCSLQLYFVFGFLFVVLIILVVTCAEITIVMCYFQVRRRNSLSGLVCCYCLSVGVDD